MLKSLFSSQLLTCFEKLHFFSSILSFTAIDRHITLLWHLFKISKLGKEQKERRLMLISMTETNTKSYLGFVKDIYEYSSVVVDIRFSHGNSLLMFLLTGSISRNSK